MSLGITFSVCPSIFKSIIVERKESELKTLFKSFSSTLIFKLGLSPPYKIAGIYPLDLNELSSQQSLCLSWWLLNYLSFKNAIYNPTLKIKQVLIE